MNFDISGDILRLWVRSAIISFALFLLTGGTLSAYYMNSIMNSREDQIIRKAESDLADLADITADSIGVDELMLINYVNRLKKNNAYAYLFVLDNKNMIVQYFDRRGRHESGRALSDIPGRKLPDSGRQAAKTVYPLEKTGEMIHDFSIAVNDRFGNRRLGSVILGLPDKVIAGEKHDELLKNMPFLIGSLIMIMVCSIISSFLCISMAKKFFESEYYY